MIKFLVETLHTFLDIVYLGNRRYFDLEFNLVIELTYGYGHPIYRNKDQYLQQKRRFDQLPPFFRGAPTAKLLLSRDQDVEGP